MHVLQPKGWEVSIQAQAGGGYIERDAGKVLRQIVDKNYQSQEGLPNIHTLQEYGIASYHLASCVKG